MIIIYIKEKINTIYAMVKYVLSYLAALVMISTGKVYGCSVAENSTRIAVAGGSITEILYALGAQHKIIALDTTSNYPLEAKNLPSIGYVRNLSSEGLLSLNPTLVLGENDMGPPTVLNQLERTGIDVRIIEERHNATGVLNKIKCIGEIINQAEKTAEFISSNLIPQIEKLETLANSNKLSGYKIMFILSVQGGAPIVSGRGTSAHGLISMSGAQNIMSQHDGWKQLSPESIIEAGPDAVVITERGLDSYGTIETLYAHPSLSLTPAFRNKRVIVMDGMAMIGFGPRTIFSAVRIADILNEMAN